MEKGPIRSDPILSNAYFPERKPRPLVSSGNIYGTTSRIYTVHVSRLFYHTFPYFFGDQNTRFEIILDR